MKKRLIKILTLILAAALSISCFAGCEIVTSNNRKDMSQVVAKVNIAKDKELLKDTFEDAFFGKELKLSDTDVDKLITAAEVSKLELVSYFINYGYNYVQQGYSYAQTFETLMSALTNRKMVLQFATLYYLNEGEVAVDADSVFGLDTEEDTDGDGVVVIVSDITVEEYLNAKDKGENEALKYLLSEENYNYALYTLRKSVNDALDTYEKDILKEEEDASSSSSGDRAIPTGADTKEDYYYPTTTAGELDYEIYTGYNSAEECGDYEKLDKSTVVTRKKAYNKFLKALENNFMLNEDDDISKIEELPYFETEMKNQLEQMVMNNFYDTLLISRTDAIEQDDYIAKYDEIYKGQQTVFKSVSEYTTALDSVSDENFILYSPKAGFGFVYNTLLPFSKSVTNLQLADLKAQLSNNVIDQSQYYYARNQLLKELTATDQRQSWFNGTTDYSYQAEGAAGTDYYGDSGYLFFKDNQGNIDKYTGKYAYNGTVAENEDGGYTLNPEKLDIGGFITEMTGYLDFVLGSSSLEVTKAQSSAFYEIEDYQTADVNGNPSYDYSKLVYYTAKVKGVSDVSRDDYFVKDSVSYKALSAMNDLQFAYTTDTAILNKYLGYSVAGKGNSTSYVAEFEYAAQEALAEGAGTISIVATDFGWHVIYVAYVYEAGETFQKHFVWEDRNQEGTFSYLFYRAYRDTIAENYATGKQNEVTTVLKDSAVTVYKSRYKDLSNLDLAR